MSNDNKAVTSLEAYAHSGDMQLPPIDGGHLALEHGSSGSVRRHSLPHLLHLSLRGRYWLVLPLSLMLCAAGVYLGWTSFSPKYRSIGRLQIRYKVPTLSANHEIDYSTGRIEDYDQVVNTMVNVILSQDIISSAMRNPNWTKFGRGASTESMKRFIENLTVEHPHQTQLIDVSLVDNDPFVAATGVQAVVHAYQDWSEANDKLVLTRLVAGAQKKVDAIRSEIVTTNQQIDTIIGAQGSEDFGPFIRRETNAVLECDQHLDILKSWLAELESTGSPVAALDKMTLQQLGMIDAGIAGKLETVNKAKGYLAEALNRYGENHDQVKSARARVDAAETEAQEYAAQWRSMRQTLGGLDGTGSRKQEDGSTFRPAQTPEAVKQQIHTIEDIREKHQRQMAEFNNQQREVRKFKDKLTLLYTDLTSAQTDLETARNEATEGLPRMVVLNYGDTPIQPYKDPRRAAIAGLGLAGFAIPIVAFLLIGLSDRRFRFSDQADAGGVGLPPLLGILPTLPDRLEDPEPAAMAAHCVHQLRIMLQVNTANTAAADGNSTPARRAYVITSASPGDGKTSLTMALGLSYAASGSRTLVIDCDMVGQGLTNRLKAQSTEGLLEALQAGTLAGRVKKTTTANLYILPLGGAESAHAGALSPQTIRKLLVEARKIFDVIVIDTGPILGSLEAQVVCAAADSVILTVARGQQQPLVQRALRMLRQVGANVGGMVFNRAQQRDFEKSVTSSSIRSMGTIAPARRSLLAEGAEESRFGPLARSVASFMPTSPTSGRPAAAKAAAPAPAADGIRVEVVSRMVESPASEDTVHGQAFDGDEEGTGTSR